MQVDRPLVLLQMEAVATRLSAQIMAGQVPTFEVQHPGEEEPRRLETRPPASGSGMRLAQLTRLLDVCHALMLSGEPPRTLRDIFYSDVALFGSQRAVDAAAADLVRAIGRVRAVAPDAMCRRGSSTRRGMCSAWWRAAAGWRVAAWS